MSNVEVTDIFATLCFGGAIAHTFLVGAFQHLSHRYPEDSAGRNLFHLLGEVEVVFGIWAAFYLGFLVLKQGSADAIHRLEGLNFTEPAFVFVILVVCSARPILLLASGLIEKSSRMLPLKRPLAFYATCLVVGPLLGSFITEPAAMTVTALILLDRFYQRDVSQKFKYSTLGLLFVNVSIGGTLTPYAAPPVLMVASKWNWDLSFMLAQFGWKAALAAVCSTAIVTFQLRKELGSLSWKRSDTGRNGAVPIWVSIIHLAFLGFIVASSHHLVVFVGLFLFFLGLMAVTRGHQSETKLREGLLVAFFLAGLVVLGAPQRWWLEPVLTKLDQLPLFLGSMGLTAFTDNAALTYLGSQVPSLKEASRYALVAGSVVGGGLTVIANAPNPAGYGILDPAFGEDGISPVKLLLHALVPTLVAGLCFWFL